MKERPIIFSAEMVRAILDGRKTQTRRVIKGTFIKEGYDPIHNDNLYRFIAPYGCAANKDRDEFADEVARWCPYGAPGGQLWVRETFGIISKGIGFNAYDEYVYRADDRGDAADIKWRPSIHMPRVASRITLEIVSVRVEKLQEISGHDVLAEGVDNGKSNPKMGIRWENMQRLAYATLWDHLNAKRGFGWDMNPWVWVNEFKRIKP